jgi:hypothetical protein
MEVRPLDRSVVERTAEIAGPASGAAQALGLAESMADPLFFECTNRSGMHVFVIERELFDALTG